MSYRDRGRSRDRDDRRSSYRDRDRGSRGYDRDDRHSRRDRGYSRDNRDREYSSRGRSRRRDSNSGHVPLRAIKSHRKKGERWYKWEEASVRHVIAGLPKSIPKGIDHKVLRALLVRYRIEELTHKIVNNKLDLDVPCIKRSPSPPPRYDNKGQRMNTRQQRYKEKYMLERQELIQEAYAVNPLFKPPLDYRPMMIKKTAKLYIPIDKYPDYNFIGLIIGPRGFTQKQMEKQTGAKIAVRGKGSIKDGKYPTPTEGEDEKLHVLITADSDEQLKQAKRLVQKLLVPVEEGKNEHKRKQLRKLAEINGTLRDNMWRGAGDDHSFDRQHIRCDICGELSHPTADCPLQGQSSGDKAAKIDEEYQAYMNMIGEKPAETKSTEDSLVYKQFLGDLEKLRADPVGASRFPRSSGGTSSGGWGDARGPPPPPSGRGRPAPPPMWGRS